MSEEFTSSEKLRAPNTLLKAIFPDKTDTDFQRAEIRCHILARAKAYFERTGDALLERSWTHLNFILSSPYFVVMTREEQVDYFMDSLIENMKDVIVAGYSEGCPVESFGKQLLGGACLLSRLVARGTIIGFLSCEQDFFYADRAIRAQKIQRITCAILETCYVFGCLVGFGEITREDLAKAIGVAKVNKETGTK